MKLMFGYRETGDITTKHKDVGSFHLDSRENSDEDRVATLLPGTLPFLAYTNEAIFTAISTEISNIKTK